MSWTSAPAVNNAPAGGGDRPTWNKRRAPGTMAASTGLAMGHLGVTLARTPEGITAMPPHLWKSPERTGVLVNLDADLTQPPCFQSDARTEPLL